ncbi:TIGR04452 family lipoprotein [Leptospira stimsonii]|uniref:TIGR04452 family lipoprotein n=1 Tax=Leptospira stimsonii TaxID=2202203 RepID=A0A4R9L3X2_9LEPT|nr:TIGR04452 family lipoprotein [Leptospira stimsonii]RHX83150.1 hypothetical protein DLM78_22740 [Leptospira stimsonii]TGK23222.1 TIGR04452 family lipoprotein [Leptospira stimsonii]TGM12970.1 TIGR04452 family lipoprotein [Leptospira stimsonii]
MKQIFGIILISTFVNCLVVDSLGLETRYKGKEARQKIADAVNKVASLRKAAGIVDTPLESLVFLLAPDFAGLEDDKYYPKARIDDCAKNIASPTGAIISPLLPMLFDCNLKPDGILLQND